MSPLLEYLSTLPPALHALAHGPSVPYKELVLGFSTLVWAFESYLVLRQLPLFSRPPPPAYTSHISSDKLAKAQAYGRDKALFSLANLAIGQALEVAMVGGDIFARLWTLSETLVGSSYSGSIPHSLLYATLLTLASFLPTLPASLYSTFVVEQRHGFNKTTLSLFFTDLLKGQLVVAALGLPLLAGFLKIIDWAGGNFVGYLMVFFIAFQLVLATIFPTFIQPLFNKFTPLRTGSLRDRVDALAKRLKFPLKHLYEIDGSKRSSHSNAYFYGLPWAKHIVIYDTLIAKSEEDEVEAVLAHELGHWHASHPTKLLTLTQVHLLLTLFLLHLFLSNPSLLASFNFPPSTLPHPPIIACFLLGQLITSPLDQAFSLLVNVLTRRFEYEADAFAVGLGGKEMGEALKRGLKKLHVENLATVNTDWLYSAYHHNHPTLPERLRALDALIEERQGPMKVRAEVKADKGEKEL